MKISFSENVRAKRKKVEFRQFFSYNSNFFLFAVTSFLKKLAGLKDFVYFDTFVTIVIKLNLAAYAMG